MDTNERAVILLDDVNLPRDQVERLLRTARNSAFILASTERHLWQEGASLALPGLPEDDALALVERHIGHPLSAEEQAAARDLCASLSGHPHRLIQETTQARDQGRPLVDVAREARAQGQARMRQKLASMPESWAQIVAVLAALDNVPQSPDHLASITGVTDAVTVLRQMQQRGLVQAASPRFKLAGTLNQGVPPNWDLAAWQERALAHYTTWAEGQQQNAGPRLLERAPIMNALAWGVGAGRWTEVQRLGRVIERALAWGRRWGAWAQVLEWLLQAARALGDQAAEAFALHQIGTRGFCVGETTTARQALDEALRIRQALGDRVGTALTQHNLSMLPPPPPPPPEPPAQGGAGAQAPTVAGVSSAVRIAIAAVIVLGLGIGGVFAWPRLFPPPKETVVAEPTRTPAPTYTWTPAETWTPIPTHTPRPTPTATGMPTHTPTHTPTHAPTSTSTRPPTSTPTYTPAHTPTFTSTPEPRCVLRNAARNLRYGPGLIYDPPIAALPEGTEMEPLHYRAAGHPGGRWIEVRVLPGSQVGWVSYAED